MSGIYIPGVEMPRCCMDCHYHKSLRDQCILTHRDQRDLWSRPDWCPIVPVPPHGRLIDADALIDYVAEKYNVKKVGEQKAFEMADFVLFDITDAPTIIPTEEASE